MSRRAAILGAYFVLGGYAVCVQATLLRETQVLLFGSELSWGLVLAFWLAGVAVGAGIGGRLATGPRQGLGVFIVASVAMPATFAGAVVLLRAGRYLLGIGPGEYVGPGSMVALTLLATVPVSVWVGMAFPAASALVAPRIGEATEKARAVGQVYLWESAGSLVGGALFSFVFVEWVGAMSLGFAGETILALAVANALRRDVAPRWAFVGLVACALGQAALLASGACRKAETATATVRWRSFAAGQQMVASADTRYQNVAVGELAGQYVLYTNGMVDATWPNHADLAVEAHLAACEHPSPRRMLVLGGGAEGLVKELLRHKPERLDYVTLDARLFAIVRGRLDELDRAALEDPACRISFDDGRRFVKRAAAEGRRYDLVVLAAPAPASTLEARLYTEEFFAQLAAAMSDDGVLMFALSVPVGYWSPEPAAYVGSMLRPLERVFPDVMLTFGSPMYVFAAKRQGVLVTSGEALAARYRERGVESPWFDPVYFAGGSDLLDAEKRQATRRAIEAHPPDLLNTDERPAAALYHMRYWLQQSEAAHAAPDRPAEHRFDVLGLLMRLRFEWAIVAVLAASALAALVATVRGRAAIRRTALLWSVGTTGFASMALEIVLLYTFQTLYGYVYSMMGLVIGVFMFGLVIGSLAMNRRLQRSAADAVRRPGFGTVAGLDLALTVFAAALVLGLALLRSWAADLPVQVVTFALVGVSGILGGLVFPLAAAVALGHGTDTGRAAGAIDAADHVGACLGALATGTLLVPVLGVTGACLVVVAMKGLSALLAGAASLVKAPRGAGA